MSESTITANTAGARYYFNPIRKGSIATDESVADRATGKPLQFDVVGAAVARAQVRGFQGARVGTPERVGRDLRAMAEALGAEEMVINTITWDHVARLRSYALLAKEFGLEKIGIRE